MKTKDSLGTRIKDFYENRFRYYLLRKSYTIIRIDGKAFHSYTRGLEKPFDMGLIDDMIETTKYLCKGIQGAKFGYVQSDEISILLTDFEENTTQAWFDANLQKMCSVSASMTTSKFNQLRFSRKIKEEGNKGTSEITNDMTLAEFDSRIFQIPHISEVKNYFLWRQQDAIRNSISALAQAHFSHSQLNNKTCDQMQNMLFTEKNINWNDLLEICRRGAFIYLVPEDRGNVTRNVWSAISMPIFSQNWEFLDSKIPQ